MQENPSSSLFPSHSHSHSCRSLSPSLPSSIAPNALLLSYLSQVQSHFSLFLLSEPTHTHTQTLTTPRSLSPSPSLETFGVSVLRPSKYEPSRLFPFVWAFESFFLGVFWNETWWLSYGVQLVKGVSSKHMFHLLEFVQWCVLMSQFL